MVGYNKPCFFIAEIGPNHNGSLENAKKLIFEAKKSGCDAIKFQYHNCIGLVIIIFNVKIDIII